MTLNKRYARNFKNNISFYICVCILTILVVVLYLDFDAAAVKMNDSLDIFRERFCVEDAQFSVLNEIDDEEIKSLEEKYNILLEKQRYIDYIIEDGNYELRILSVPKKINLYALSTGDVEKDNPGTSVQKGKILLNEGLAIGNEIKDGDIIRVDDNAFEFISSFERPDYLFPIKEVTDTYALKAEFGVGLVSDEDFERLADKAKELNKVKEYYVIKYNSDNKNEVRKEINERFHMLSYLKADTNTRVGTPKREITQTSNLMNVAIIVLVIFISVIIAAVIGRRIKGDRRQIGILIALGYKKKALSRHYAVYGLVSGLAGTLLGVIIAFILSDKLIGFLFFKIEPIPTGYNISLVNVILSVLFPTLVYTFSVYRSAKKVMKNDVITMISGRSGRKGASKLRMEKSSLKASTKYKLRQIIGKPGRSIIVILGLGIGGMLYSFCLACIDSMDSYVKHTVDQIGTFNYEYFLKNPEIGKPDDGNAILGVSYEVKGREDIMMLLGIDSPDMINFSDPDGNKLNFEKDRFYITSMASLAFDKEKGDTVTIVDPITLDEYNITVTDIVKNDSQAAIYCSRENAVEILGFDTGLTGGELPYNVIMSEKALDIEEDKLMKTISKQSLADQINEVKIGMENVTGAIDVFAIIICVAVVYMMVNVLITESTPSVSMLKVLGYRNKEINSMVLNVYHLLVPIALVLSLLLGFFSVKAVFAINVSEYKTYLETLIYPLSILKMSALIIASYVLSLFLLRGKAGKVDLVESLKDNRE